ncbi:MAG: nucleoside triphosphate pyrophosphohydrolase [Bacillaceae bacterium]
MKKIIVIGLGASDFEQMPIGIYKRLKATDHVYVRTINHPVLSLLQEEGVTFTAFDEIYEKHDQFEQVYEEIVSVLMNGQEEEIVYAVPGHPLVAERTVQLLIEKEKNGEIELEIAGGQSFLDAMFTSLKIDPIEGFQFLDGTSFEKDAIILSNHLIFCQVYDHFIASNVKLSLMDLLLPDEYEVYIVTAAGSKDEVIKKVPLYELDREATLNNLTSVYVPPVKEESLLYGQFNTLRGIIRTLRGPNGCPWDKEQTNQSLKPYLIEEAYELIDAINEEDDEAIIEELGDVLLQVMLHAQIGEDEGWFTIDEVIATLSEKMVRRHPHVFGDVQVKDSDDVLKNWNAIKKEEKQVQSVLAGIPKEMPSLLKAYHLQRKAGKVGFDWDAVEPMIAKVEEEIGEWKEELTLQSTKVTQEFGDILFALVNIARYYNIDPEEALHQTNKKFKRRFQYIEKKVEQSGQPFDTYTLEQLDAFWEEAKKEEQK